MNEKEIIEEMDEVVTHFIECDITEEQREKVIKAYKLLLEKAGMEEVSTII